MTNNLGQDNNNKKNLPPPKINDEFAHKAKRAIQSSIIEMGGS